MSMTTWRKGITQALNEKGESWEDVEYCTLSDAELDEEFYDGCGRANGTPFTVWTENRVYFPVEYAGEEWVDSVSRKIDKKPTEHIGGG